MEKQVKKIVIIRIEVDMSGEGCDKWTKPNDFFIDEVDNVLDKLSSIGRREKSRYSSEEGHTDEGTKFKIVVKKTSKKK